jgi:hypothetical protein
MPGKKRKPESTQIPRLSTLPIKHLKIQQASIDHKTDQLDQLLQKYDETWPQGIFQFLGDIPKKEAWRFLVDGRDQQHESWKDYDDREPGYTLAMSTALSIMLDRVQSSAPLDLAFIKLLHFTALNGVNQTNYWQDKKYDKYEFDNYDQCGVSLNTMRHGTINLIAFQEILEKIQKGNPLLHVEISDSPHYAILNSKSVGKDDDVNNIAKKNQHSSFLRSFGSIPNGDVKIADNFFNQLIEKYNITVEQATSPREKLKVIVQFIMECEQSHPYVDGNGRTFCTLLLNFLLIKQGFPAVILEDPNRFDRFDTNSLVDDVINGMQRTLTLAMEKTLYKISTEDFLKYYGCHDQATFKQCCQKLKKYFEVPKENKLTSESKQRAIMTRKKLADLSIPQHKLFFAKRKSRVCKAFDINEKNYDLIMHPFKKGK